MEFKTSTAFTQGSIQGLRIAKYVLLFFFSVLVLACEGDSPTAAFVSEPQLITDGNYVVEFPYSTAACTEILPMIYANSDRVPANSVASITVITTSCYHVHAKVVSPLPDTQTIRTFDQYFSIYGRQDGDKNRGVPSYVSWDGLDDAGKVAPKLRYLWRLYFTYGGGNHTEARADINLAL